jgi:monoamine oxidase
MMRPEVALLAGEALLEMDRKLSLASTGAVALWAGYAEGASLSMMIELVLAREDSLAA